jgi:hypothetical protein
MKQKSDGKSISRNSDYHKKFALISAREAERVIKYFEKEHPKDNRPRLAIKAIRDWAIGKKSLSMAEVRKLSLDSHAAARVCKTEAAKFAARAAGQAVAVWHVPTHAMAVPYYVCKAIHASQK